MYHDKITTRLPKDAQYTCIRQFTGFLNKRVYTAGTVINAFEYSTITPHQKINFSRIKP